MHLLDIRGFFGGLGIIIMAVALVRYTVAKAVRHQLLEKGSILMMEIMEVVVILVFVTRHIVVFV